MMCQHETLIPRSEVRRRVGGISRATEHRRLKDDPDWPRPLAIGPGKSGYVLSEVDAYVANKIAARDAEAGKLRSAGADKTERASRHAPGSD